MREVNGPTIAYYAARRALPVTVVQLREPDEASRLG